MSLGGGGGGGRTSVSGGAVDPALAKMNELLFGQVQQGVQQTGGLPAALSPNPFSQPSARELQILDQASSLPFDPLTFPQEEAGLNVLAGAMDPSLGINLARDLFREGAGPIIRNNLTVRGQGRSGAVDEALASGFGQMVLPLFQGAQQAAQTFGRSALDLGPVLESRRLGRLGTGLEAAGGPRVAQSREFMRPLDLITKILSGVPAGGGDVQTTRLQTQTRPETDWLRDILVPLGASILAS